MTAKRKAEKGKAADIIGRSTKRKSPATAPQIGEPGMTKEEWVAIGENNRFVTPVTPRALRARPTKIHDYINDAFGPCLKCGFRSWAKIHKRDKPKPARVRLDWNRVWSIPFSSVSILSDGITQSRMAAIERAVERELRGTK